MNSLNCASEMIPDIFAVNSARMNDFNKFNKFAELAVVSNAISRVRPFPF